MTDNPNFELLSKKAKLMIIFSCVALAALIGLAASYFIGPDNAVEQVAEKVIDEVIEKELHLPEGSIDVDLNINKN